MASLPCRYFWLIVVVTLGACVLEGKVQVSPLVMTSIANSTHLGRR